MLEYAMVVYMKRYGGRGLISRSALRAEGGRERWVDKSAVCQRGVVSERGEALGELI